MGISHYPPDVDALRGSFIPGGLGAGQALVALAGNPNTGKSTVFNALTGLHQHTGNWPGKTVTQSRGTYSHRNRTIAIVDLPGTYSLLSNSPEELIARDFLCFAAPDATVVVVDASCLERNLNLVFQVMEITPRVVVCVNLVDEAMRKGISVDLDGLSYELGVPVVATVARTGKGLERLKDILDDLISGRIKLSPRYVVYDDDIEDRLAGLQANLHDVPLGHLNPRWVALRLLDGDAALIEGIVRRLGLYGSAAETGSRTNMQPDNLDGLQETMERAGEVRGREGRWGQGENSFRDRIVSAIYNRAESITRKVVRAGNAKGRDLGSLVDDILTSRIFGYPAMLALFGALLWITISGANVPSELLARVLFALQDRLMDMAARLQIPGWLQGVAILGTYRSVAWVVSVMLPPMAIFFPLFTLLEDLGYLPRVAFNLDSLFRKAGAHGKQALTMSMGFGCNAAGVIACRIIESPRERLIAILTNNFVPCNGRFPTLITLASLLASGEFALDHGSFLASGIVVGMVVLGIAVTLATSWALAKTILRGVPSFFALELPPYRRPQVIKTIVRSVMDRTLFVLLRAVTVAAPAGAVTWALANTSVGGISILKGLASLLDFPGRAMGLDGFILAAFILGLPANEIVMPIMLMGYLSSGTMLELGGLDSLGGILAHNDWTWLTALNMMLFSLLHYPCGTTLMTIHKETSSLKWTFLSAAIPTCIGVSLCLVVTGGARLLGLV
ncbi:MAG TPA: ferrous iron transport protein B [Firmicutes bacterium]|nr:ferrous iron transport protein B [Bacillota bacterium]